MEEVEIKEMRKKVEIKEMNESGLHYKTKSFKFSFSCDVPYESLKKDGFFRGFIRVSSQDWYIFNGKTLTHGHKRVVWPSKRNFCLLPLLYNNNPRMPIGRVWLGRFPRLSRGHPQKALITIEGNLMFEVQKAKEIYASIEQKRQDAIKELSLGYNMIEKGTAMLYELSIKGPPDNRQLGVSLFMATT